jgi:glutaredoxin 3
MSVAVEIFTKRCCSSCQRAKELLRVKGVNFTEHDITDEEFRAAEMQQRSQHRTVTE